MKAILFPIPTGGIAVDTDATDYDFMKMGRNLAQYSNADNPDMNMDPKIYVFLTAKKKD